MTLQSDGRMGFAIDVRTDPGTIRSSICDRALVGLSLLAVPGLSLSLHRQIDIGWQPVMGVHAVLAAVLLTVTLLRRRISYPRRAGTLVGLFLLFGIAGEASFGPGSVGPVAMIAAGLVAFLLLDGTAALIVAAAALAAHFLLYGLLATGHLHVTPALVTDPTNFSTWLASAALIIFCVGGIGGAISVFNRQLVAGFTAVAASEANLRAILDNANFGILVLQAGHFVAANRRAANFAGYTIEEFYRLPFTDFLHPDDRAMVLDRAGRRLKGEDVPATYEVRVLTKDGGHLPIDISAAIAEWNGDRAIVVCFKDLTEIKQASESLRRSEERFRALSVNSSDLIWQADAQGKPLGDNPSWQKFTGRTLDSLADEKWMAVAHPEDRARARESLETPFLRGEPFAIELRLRRFDGEWRDMEMHGAPIRAAESADLEWIGLGRDITDIKRTGEALRRSQAALLEAQQRYVDLFEFSPDGLVMTDAEGRITLVNRESERIFGWTRQEMIGQPVEMLMPVGVRRNHVARRYGFADAASRRPMAAGMRSLRGLRKDGSEFPVEIDLAPVASQQGAMVAAVVRDVTAQRALEEQLAQALKMDAIGKLTGGMAHDFNNYLGVIIGNLDLLKQHTSLDPAATRLIDMSMSGALSAAELTQSLLAFARRQTLAPRTTQVNESVAKIVSLLKRLLGEDIAIELNLAAGLWPVTVDVARLESCIVNLANNARDAMPDGGRLTISTSSLTLDGTPSDLGLPAIPGDYVLLEVADSGVGMTAETVAQVFEPFFTTKQLGHGTGLGLSMVYGFVKQSGGYVGIKSEVGRGTVVRIYLPRSADGSATEAGPTSLGAPKGGKETILLVEDHEMMRTIVRQQLDMLGYQVVEAESGEAALQVLLHRQVPVDLLFTDVVMPGPLNGHELAKRGRAAHPGLKVLLTSGYWGGTASRGLADITEFAILEKPYRLHELAAAVREALNERPGDAG